MDEDATEIQNVGAEENFDISSEKIKMEKINDEKESDQKEVKDKGKVGVKDGRTTSTSNQHPPTNYRVKVSGLPRFYSFGVRKCYIIFTYFSHF